MSRTFLIFQGYQNRPLTVFSEGEEAILIKNRLDSKAGLRQHLLQIVDLIGSFGEIGAVPTIKAVFRYFLKKVEKNIHGDTVLLEAILPGAEDIVLLKKKTVVS